MSTFMVPEKGRNAYAALRRELDGEPLHAEWLRSVIDERGKRAAKTGVGFDAVRNQVETINRLATDESGRTLQLSFREYGRLKPRAVFERAETTTRRIDGYESPADAWESEATRFYAGYDETLEALLERADGERAGSDEDSWRDTTRPADPLGVADGFEAAVERAMAERGYELVERLGNEVQWAAMSAESVPEEPRVVLVPAAFPRLGTWLAERVWEPGVRTETYEAYAARTETTYDDEEGLLAAAPGVAGIYMTVSGSTAREYGLAVRPVAGAVSRLGVFETTEETRMPEIRSLKGFYDRYPDEFASWRRLIDTVEETAREFGFREVDTPAVERTDLYRVKSGDELLDQTYSFEDRGGREVTLTPEQTPTRARMVQAKRQELSAPIKWFDTSKRWRYEQVQKGRDREFFQTDIDVFGVESVAADAEVIACGARIYQKLGVADSVEFLVNDRRLLEALLEAEGIDNTREVMQVIDDEEKLSDREFREALEAVGVTGGDVDRVAEIAAFDGPIADVIEELETLAPDDERTAAAVERIAELADRLEAYGVAEMCRLDLSIVRGLAYYTGLVFEAFDSEGELRALFGGGRYDDLVGLFGDREVPAVGFAFGYSTTRELLAREGELPPESVATDAYVAPVSESVTSEAVGIATQLREVGMTVETNVADRTLGDQLAYADGVGARVTLIVGERDLANDEVTVRDMASGEERQVPRDDVVGGVQDVLDGE
ncbi:MAG: histidine--tRNA ligase [Halobaculum sp.]